MSKETRRVAIEKANPYVYVCGVSRDVWVWETKHPEQFSPCSNCTWWGHFDNAEAWVQERYISEEGDRYDN